MAIADGVKDCNLSYKTKFYTVTEQICKLEEPIKNDTLEILCRSCSDRLS